MTRDRRAEPLVPGVVMGTWPYMAPEQILGRLVDARTDVFAFGVVLYEMVAGRRPFGGDSAPQVMAAIRARSSLALGGAANVPHALQRVVEKCLAKPPEARWQSMSDLGDQLRWIEEDSADQRRAPTPLENDACRC